MSVARVKSTKSRMSIYISEANRRRLDRVPRGQKTAVVNQALEQGLARLEQQEHFDAFLNKVRAIRPVKATLSSEEMVRQLRETGDIAREIVGK